MTWVMFWGEFLCLLFFLIKTRLARRAPASRGYDALAATGVCCVCVQL